MATPPLYLGLDIGGTKCSAVVGGADNTHLATAEWPSLADRGPDPMLADLLAHARGLIAQHPTIAAVGVSIGGPLDAEQGVIYSPPNLPGWDSIPLKQLLIDELHLPTHVEHDAAACALAEYHWGAGRDAKRLVYLTCGTGFGAGLVFDGQPIHGHAGFPIEIGHVRYRDDGPTAFGKQGSFEAFCAGSSLPKLAAFLFPKRWSSRPPTGPELSGLWQANDPDAATAITLNATATGDACALLAALLSADRILLGSLARYLGPPWLELVLRRFNQQCHPSAAQHCQILPAGLGDRLQLSSALAAAI